MNRQGPGFDPDLEALLERGRIIRPVPDVVRARARARARASMAATAAPPQPAHATRHRGLALAVAASVALVVGAAAAVAALRIRASYRSEPEPPMSQRALPPARASMLDVAPAASTVAPQRSSGPKPPRSWRPASAQESYAAELDLLQQAQSAYAGGDFSRALLLVAEHGRRFRDGRLAEEREALRGRSLARSGRADEARRATTAFASRFPRSVLLPRLLDASHP